MSLAERGREFRHLLLDSLKGPDPEGTLEELCRRVPVRRFLRPLMSLIRSDDERVKHRAVSALGQLTVKLAEADLEAARDVVRRLFLSLTEESGGIGWGSPEAIGEILARHEGLAREYADIFISYARAEEENYLDYGPLQRGVLRGLVRLAQARREMLLERDVMECLVPHLRSQDATARALAAWTISILGTVNEAGPEWDEILADSAEADVYLDGELTNCRVQDLARRST